MIIMSILHNFGKKKKKKKLKLVGIFELHSNLEADVAPIHWLKYSEYILDYRLRK